MHYRTLTCEHSLPSNLQGGDLRCVSRVVKADDARATANLLSFRRRALQNSDPVLSRPGNLNSHLLKDLLKWQFYASPTCKQNPFQKMPMLCVTRNSSASCLGSQCYQVKTFIDVMKQLLYPSHIVAEGLNISSNFPSRIRPAGP